MKATPSHSVTFARPLSLASRLTRTFRNLFLTLRPHTPGALRPRSDRRLKGGVNRPAAKARRARQYSLPSLLLLLLLSFSLPHSAHAQANPTVGGGGACTGWVASDTTTQGAQLAENDGLYTCQSSAWVPETLVVGSVTQSGAVPSCGAGTAGMLYYTGGTVEFCNGTSFTTFGSSVTLNGILAATGANTISSGSNAQVWNWSLAGTGHTAFTFGETSAATSGGQIVDITTAGGSTAVPLTISNGASSTNPISINMSLGGLAIGGVNVLDLPFADTTSIAVGGAALTGQSSTGLDNIAVGYQAGYWVTTGTHNVAIGVGAMFGNSAAPMTASYNTAVGNLALQSIQGGGPNNNTAIGAGALSSNTGGHANTALGESSLYSTTSNYNTGVGTYALYDTTTGPNDALGYEAGYYITSGASNVAIGYEAMLGVSATPLTQCCNVAVGYEALTTIQGATIGNTAVGEASLFSTTTGSYNVALGEQALYKTTTGTDNSAIGDYALYSATGSPNTALGYEAGFYIASGSDNIAIGYNAMVGVSATPLTAANGGNIAIGDSALTAIAGAAAGNVAVGYNALTSSTVNGANPNTAMGYEALQYATTGTNNTAIGNLAMQGSSAHALTGNGNVGVGDSALKAIQTTAVGNAAIGANAMQSNTTGSENTALGNLAMQGNQTGTDNVAVGYAAMYAVTGSNNTAVGWQSLNAITTGTDSTAIGYQALYGTTGSPNDALGYNAGEYISTGASNVALGYESMQGVSATPLTGSQNTAVGTNALSAIQGAAASNTALGYYALNYDTTGAFNVAIGAQALQYMTTGQTSTAVGVAALNGTTAGPNDALGFEAGQHIASGASNVAIGYEAIQGVAATPLTGGYNTAVGAVALNAAQGAADDNTAIGQSALTSNTTGANNTAIGQSALYDSTTGSDSTAVGQGALYSVTGSPNDALGYQTGHYISTGASNVALGFEAMQGVSATPLTGSNNTALGNSALLSIQGAGAGNTALGYQAGASSNPTTTGTNNVFIGYQAGALAATDSNEIVIGSTAMGRGSNSVVIGNGSITDAYFGMTTTCTNGTACGPGSTNSNAGAAGAVVLHAAGYNRFSDQRLKKDIRDSDLGLDFILKLRPVSYVLKAGKSLMNYGFIAQEVEQALDGRTTGMVTREKDEMGTYEIDYSSLIAPTVKAVQQQQQEIADLKQLSAAQQKEIADDKQQISDLKQIIAAQQKEINDLKAAHTPTRPHPTYE
jgi:trimeric autotransporter adhesin